MGIRRLIGEQNNLSKRRLAYTLAAGAASFGTYESTAEAAISYSGIKNLQISAGGFQDLNLDGDTNTDIRLKNYAYNNGINYQGATVRFAPGQIVGFRTNNLYYVSALHTGDSIDSNTVGPTFYGSMALGNATTNQNPNAQFTNVSKAYIGLDFRINNGSDLYFGWIRVSVNNAAGTFLVHDWAYEKSPGVGILAGDGPTYDFNGDGKIDAADYVVWRKFDNTAAGYQAWRAHFGETLPGSGSAVGMGSVPEPMTLGLLAVGSAGIGLLRRERRGTS